MILSPDRLKVGSLQVPGAAVPAVQEPGAQEAGRARTGVVLAFPREGDLEREGSSPSAIGKGCESSV